MKQIEFKNMATCPLLDKQPGETFLLEVLEDGVTPAAAFWRKRLQDGSVVIPATTASEPVASDEAKPKKGK